MERLGYGRDFRDDYDDSDVEQTHDHQEYRGDTYEPSFDLDPDSPHWEDHSPENLRDAVDHQAELKAEAQKAYYLERIGYIYGARLSREGKKWVPPDTTDYVAPVFVRVADLQSWNEGPAGEQVQDS